MYKLVFLCCAVLCRYRLLMGRSLIQGVLPNYLKEFIASEVNSESEQARGSLLYNVRKLFSLVDLISSVAIKISSVNNKTNLSIKIPFFFTLREQFLTSQISFKKTINSSAILHFFRCFSSYNSF